jgi:hypothetical protein
VSISFDTGLISGARENMEAEGVDTVLAKFVKLESKCGCVADELFV